MTDDSGGSAILGMHAGAAQVCKKCVEFELSMTAWCTTTLRVRPRHIGRRSMSWRGELGPTRSQSRQEQGDFEPPSSHGSLVLRPSMLSACSNSGAADVVLAGGRTKANLHVGPTLTSGATTTSSKTTLKTSEG